MALIAGAIPLSVSFMLGGERLNTFAYRVELGYAPFLLVVFASVMVVILAAGYSAWKSGRMNPVDVIKSE